MRSVLLATLAVLVAMTAAGLALQAGASYFPTPEYGGWKVTAQFCGPGQP